MYNKKIQTIDYAILTLKIFFNFFVSVVVIDSQPFCCTLFALKMALVESQNVHNTFSTSCLAVIFGIRLLFFCQLYHVPTCNSLFMRVKFYIMECATYVGIDLFSYIILHCFPALSTNMGTMNKNLQKPSC